MTPPTPTDFLRVQKNILEIAALWPALRKQLEAGSGGTNTGPVTGTRERPMPIRADVFELIKTIDAFAMHYAHVLIEDTDWQPPSKPAHTDDILRAIAGTNARNGRLGHFTDDDRVWFAIEAEAAKHRKSVRAKLFPRGYRWQPLDQPCAETVDGQPCPGVYEAPHPLDRDHQFNPDDRATFAALTCRDRRFKPHVTNWHHVVDPFEWTNALEIAKGDLALFHQLLVRGRQEVNA